MFSKGSTNFTRETPECGLSSKEGRYGSESLSLSTLDKDEEKANRVEASVAQNGPNGRLDMLGRPIIGAKYRPHSEHYRKLQLACYNFLERPRGLFPHLYHAVVCVLVVVSLILTALTTVNTQTRTALHAPVIVVEFILVLIFLVEYCLRLWSAGCRSTYVGIKGRLKFAKKTYAILDLIVIISSISALVLVATATPPTIAVRLVRFLPLLRVLRFDRQGETWKLLASVIYIHRQELVTTLYFGFITLIFASFVLYLVEKDDQNTKLDSWPNSFWWGIVTLTTIGYGDKTPITWYGRLCAALFAVFGISFFALPAGILGSGFALKVTQQQRQKHFHRRRRPAAILLQSHWRMYCADINSKSVATWLPHIYYHRQGTSDKIVSSSMAVSSSNTVQGKKGRKLSAVWRNRNEGKASRSHSVDVIRGSRSDSSPLADSGGSATQRGSISSTLDTGFFVPGENLHCTLVYTKKPIDTSKTFASDEANISISEDGEPAITLTQAQKHAIRLIRLLKLNVAIRKFKEARKPYDVKDVIEQYSTGHVEMLSRMKSLQQRIDKISGERETSMYEDSTFKSNVSARLMKVEHQVTVLDRKVDVLLSLLTKMSGTDPKTIDMNFPGSPPPPGGEPASRGLPTVVIGSDKNLESRVRSESFPSTHLLSNNIPPWNPKHSQSDPVLKFDATLDLSKIQGPRTPSLSSEDSHESKDMDCLSTPGMTTVSPNRILGVHGRQLSDVTEGDESVSSDSKENALDSKFSRESTLDSIEDAKEPSEDVEIPMYDPLLNPYISDPPHDPKPPDSPTVWEKKIEDPKRQRNGSHKTSSTSSFGTLVGEGSGNGSMEHDATSSEVFPTGGSVEKEGIDALSKGDSSEVDSGSVDSDPTAAPSDDAKAKRRALRRCTPIEV